MTVLDASAVLALLGDEPGSDAVMAALPSARLSAVNLAEVLTKLLDRGLDARLAAALLDTSGVTIVPFSARQAELATAVRTADIRRRLSLGDRCCLALTLDSDEPEVLTADREWATLDLPLTVRLLR